MDGSASAAGLEAGTGNYQADSPYLRLIGQPVIDTGAQEHPLAPERRHQLLAYLACREGWVPREEIADLFWESHDGAPARRNLRRLLHDVRRIPWLAGFDAQGDALRWRVSSDRAGFARALARGDWRESVRLGPGTLLAGLEKGATDAFHDWLRVERQSQLTRWRESVVRRRDELGDDAAARIELARFALDHDPFNEAALQDLVDVLHASGRHDEAQEAFTRYAARIQEELGVAPAIVARPIPPIPASGPNTCASKPASAAGNLIGRRLEQSQLVETLRRDDCRRATILGPGGVGKSSLASSARVLLRDDFPDGVRWVSLRDLTRGVQIPARIAEACGLKGALPHDAAAALAARIGERVMLLVLDNCEHLPEVAAVGDALVASCPNLKILHASRARIGCAGEFLLPLAGLAVPEAEERELEVLRAFDSMRLFEARARRVDPAFDLERCAADVARLVRMVEGLPLAIEMAAACARLLPPAEIVRDISQLLDMVDATAACPEGTPCPNRSLRASFEHSWQLLAGAERKTLAQLAVFDGGFSLEAAAAVAGAGIAELAALLDKSLVGATGEGRFSLHPLIREFAREHLEDEPGARDRHAAHFAGIMAWRAQAKKGAAAPWAFEDVTHCLEAWRWVAASGDVARMQRMAIPLVRLFNSFLRWQEGIDTFEAALAAVTAKGGAAGRLRAALLYGLALCRFYNGEMDAAEEAARRSLRRCHALRIRELLPAADLHIIGSSLAWRGESVQARRFLEQSLALARELDEPESIAKARYGIAFLEQAAGNWSRARELYAQTAKLAAGIGNHQWQALSLNGLGSCWLAEDRAQEALGCFAEGIRVCTEHEVHGRRSFLLANHGLALLRTNDLPAAARSIERALREGREWNICTATMESHLARCALALARGDLELARSDLRSAMQVACKIQAPLRRMGVVRHWGQWLLAAGRRADGVAVLEFVRAHALAMRKDRDAAAEALSNGMTRQHVTERSRNAPHLTLASLEAAILDPNP